MNLSKIAKNLSGQPMFKLRDRIPKDCIRFEIGDSTENAPEEVIQATIESLKKNETHYTDSSGLLELKQEIMRVEGFIEDINQIVIMPANAIIDFTVRCLCGKEDKVLLTPPCFPTYSSVLNYNSINKWGTPKLSIVNSPNNPSGEMLSKDFLLSLYKFSKEKDFYILSDEVYKDIYYGEKPFSLTEIDKCKDRVIYLQSFSKLYSMSGFRIGYCVAPVELAEKLGLMLQTIYSCLPIFIQRGAIAALQNKESIVDRRMRRLRKCRELMVSGLNSTGIIDCPYPDGGIYCFPSIKRTGMTGDELFEELLKVGVSILPGSCFGKGLDSYIRLCFDNEEETIEKGISKISAYFNGRADGI